jgi:hypothetical protein
VPLTPQEGRLLAVELLREAKVAEVEERWETVTHGSHPELQGPHSPHGECAGR